MVFFSSLPPRFPAWMRNSCTVSNWTYLYKCEETDLLHYQQGYVKKKKKNRGWAMQAQFVTDVPHFQANHFSSQDNEEAPLPPFTHTHAHTNTHTLSYTVHQLSSSCHGCRQPGSGVYSQSIQNGPCHFYWISHQQKGQLRWWVLVGGQLKTTVPTRQTAPSRALLCPRCGLAHVGGVQQRSACSLAVEQRVRSLAQVVLRSYTRSLVLCDKEIPVSFLWGDNSVSVVDIDSCLQRRK